MIQLYRKINSKPKPSVQIRGITHYHSSKHLFPIHLLSLRKHPLIDVTEDEKCAHSRLQSHQIHPSPSQSWLIYSYDIVSTSHHSFKSSCLVMGLFFLTGKVNKVCIFPHKVVLQIELTLSYDNLAFKHEPQIICYMS